MLSRLVHRLCTRLNPLVVVPRVCTQSLVRLVARLLEKAQLCVWTCKLCHSRFEAKTPKKLSEMSKNHNARRHPDRDMAEKNGTRQYVEPVIPSHDIPLDQRAWCCPHPRCQKGLPHLPAGQHRKSVQARNAAEHPRAKVSSVKSRKRLWTRWRKDKSTVPSLSRGIKLRVASQHKSKQNRLDKNKCGHKAVLFHPDWATIPKTAKSASPKQQKGSGTTCTRCWRFVLKGTLENSRNPQLCKKRPEPCNQARASWLRIQSSPRTVHQLLNIWKVTLEQAKAKFERVVEEGIVSPSQAPQVTDVAVYPKLLLLPPSITLEDAQACGVR